MIARHTRTLAAWLRNRRAAPVAPVDLARAEHEMRHLLPPEPDMELDAA